MRLLYNLSIASYGFAIRLASIFNGKAKRWVSGRKDWQANLLRFVQSNEKPIVWVHAASLGEFEQGRPIIEEIKAGYPTHAVVLTFFSPSGYEVRKDYDQADYVCYLPLDSQRNAKKFIGTLNPQVALIIKYEFWLNHISELKDRKIPHFLISGIFRESQVFFKSYGKMFRDCLRGFDHLFVQDNNSHQLLESINCKNNSIGGDTRFDRVYSIREASEALPEIEAFTARGITIIVGSSWPTEEGFLLKYMAQNEGFNYILAPHNLSSSRMAEFIRKSELPAARFSDFPAMINKEEIKVLVIDSIGLLSRIYKYSDIAIVGGGFDGGIHNILEAAVWGQPVIVGPRYQNFKEANDLIESGGVSRFNNQESFEDLLNSLANNPEILKEKAKKCLDYCLENKGATARTMDKLKTYLIP